MVQTSPFSSQPDRLPAQRSRSQEARLPVTGGLGQRRGVWGVQGPPAPGPVTLTHHMSMGVEYSVDPSSTSGGLYHRVTTSLE